MRVVFLGTPDIAATVLEALFSSAHEVAGVVTQPDRVNGRGKKITNSPVKTFALERGLPILQFERISAEGEEAIRALRPDVMVTCAYGQILKQNILDICPIYNVHASLLPKYRGSSPVQWALINGETEVGVTVMKTDIGVDTGDIALRERFSLQGEENAEQVLRRMASVGGELIVRALDLLEKGALPLEKQDEAQATHCRMLTKEDGRLDFTRSAKEAHDRVRGVTPWPGAFTTTPFGTLKVLQSAVCEGSGGSVAGEVVVSDHKNGLVVKCGEGYLTLLTVQGENAKAMDAKAYLLGHKIPVGSVLGA